MHVRSIILNYIMSVIKYLIFCLPHGLIYYYWNRRIPLRSSYITRWFNFLFADSHSGLRVSSNIVSPITVCPVSVDTRCVILFICRVVFTFFLILFFRIFFFLMKSLEETWVVWFWHDSYLIKINPGNRDP